MAGISLFFAHNPAFTVSSLKLISKESKTHPGINGLPLEVTINKGKYLTCDQIYYVFIIWLKSFFIPSIQILSPFVKTLFRFHREKWRLLSDTILFQSFQIQIFSKPYIFQIPIGEETVDPQSQISVILDLDLMHARLIYRFLLIRKSKLWFQSCLKPTTWSSIIHSTSLQIPAAEREVVVTKSPAFVILNLKS